MTKKSNLLTNLQSLRMVRASSRLRSHFTRVLIPSLPAREHTPAIFSGFYTRLAFVLLLLACLSTGGIVLASYHSSPGSILYPVKTLVQHAQNKLFPESNINTENSYDSFNTQNEPLSEDTFTNTGEEHNSQEGSSNKTNYNKQKEVREEVKNQSQPAFSIINEAVKTTTPVQTEAQTQIQNNTNIINQLPESQAVANPLGLKGGGE